MRIKENLTRLEVHAEENLRPVDLTADTGRGAGVSPSEKLP